MGPVKIAAVADVHSPRFLHEFKTVLKKHETPDLFLFAGDIINRGKVDEYPKVLDILESQFGANFPVVACFGNEEPIESRDELRLLLKNRVTFLDEDAVMFNLSGSKIAIVGMSATPDPPTESLSETFAEIRGNFEGRSQRLSALLRDATETADYVFLLMHFSPLSESNPSAFSWWVSKAIEKNPPSYVIHGHVHDSTRNDVKIQSTIIRNVALPATGSITELNF